jgi:assimilatory nitrate reductase catalytic subunit
MSPVQRAGDTVETRSPPNAPTISDAPTTPKTVTPTHCPYCALQCGQWVDDSGRVDAREFPTNRGGMCQKGWTSGALLGHPERLTTPLLRTSRDADLAAVGWDTALAYVADRLRALRAEHGPDAVAVFGGGGLTNEKAYLLGKFARVALGTSQIDYNGRFCMSSAAAAGNRAFGVDRGMPFPVTDLDDAEVIVLAGANIAETMPPLMGHLTGARLVVIDPRCTLTAERATASDGLHLAPVPGTDLVLALGMLHTAVVDGHLDTDYLAERTTGFDDAWRIAVRWWPERAERVCGVAAADMRTVVGWLAGASRRYVLTARGAEQHAHGVDTVTAWINLALALGMPGRVGSGFGTITGQGNGQGGREHGQKADQLPGYRSITDPAARAHVAGVWGVDPDALPGPGRSATELLDALGHPGGPKALLVFSSNVLVSAPDSGAVAERLAALDMLVVADFLPGETAMVADVVLPVAQWAEEEGTMTNLEGRVLRRLRAMPPPEGVRTDLDVVAGLAAELGVSGFPTDPQAVFDELRAASAGGPADYSGISYARLDAGEALHWPCPTPQPGEPEHPGTPRLFLDRFGRADGRAHVVAVDHTDAAELPDAQYPLRATTGRVLVHYQSGAQTRRVAELAGVVSESFVEVHPDTARRAGRGRVGPSRLTPRYGAGPSALRRVAAARHGVLAVPLRRRAGRQPHHQPGTGPDQPDAGVQGLRRALGIGGAVMSSRVVVVGNGLVGARFADEVRRRDPDGARVRLTVVGAEPGPAYNRVLLSTVLAGDLSARAVQLYPDGWAARQQINLRTGVTVTAIERDQRTVRTIDGDAEPYDELVLATGSRAWLPPVPGLNEDTVAAFRDLADCERILDLARPGTRFAVLGGGLLGCEAARGLAGRGVHVTLLHRAPHLMERQLDTGAGEVLAATMRRLGIDVRLGVDAVAWEPGTGLRCSDGTLVAADALVVAAGVRAETGLADAAALAIDRGVLVNDRLATSADHVHAIGDCAQHPGTAAGLVQPGWEQAAVLADLLTGADSAASYQGTRAVTRLKARDIDLATVGDPATLSDADADARAEVLRFSDPAGGRYASLALRDDHVVGGAMIGMPDAAASMIQFYDNAIPAPTDRLGLLLGRALPRVATETADPAQLPASAVVCRCNNVTKGALLAAWNAGATDPAALSHATRAGTGCGSCKSDLAAISTWTASSPPPHRNETTESNTVTEPARCLSETDTEFSSRSRPSQRLSPEKLS